MRGEVPQYLLHAYSTYSKARYPGTNETCESSQLVQLTNAASSTGTSNSRTLLGRTYSLLTKVESSP